MDGDPDDSRTDPIDPKLEALLKQELATPRESEERTMDGLALRLKTTAPRARKIARLETGWRRHVLAAVVMLVLVIGLFALMALSKGPAPVRPDQPEKSAVAAPNAKKDLKGDERTPPLPKQADIIPQISTEAQIAVLVHEIEDGKETAREALAMRLINAGLAGTEALERELNVLTHTPGNADKTARISDALALFQKEQDKQFNEICEALGDQMREPHTDPDLKMQFTDSVNVIPIPLGKNAFYLAPEPKLLEKLNQKITFDFADADFAKALATIKVLSGVKVEVDSKAAIHAPPITLRVTDMSLDLALDWIAKMQDLEVVKRGSMVILTTPERAARFSLQQMAFKLPVAPGSPAWTPEETKVICVLLAPGIAEPVDGGIFTAFATGPELAKIEQQLKQIGGDVPKPAQWMVDTDQKLTRHVTVELVDQNFKDMINFLDSLTKVNIIIDPRLSMDGTVKTPISLKVQNLPVGEALARVLQQANVAADYRTNGLLITHGPIQPETSLCTFDLQPAIKAGTAADKLQVALDDLAAQMPSTVPSPPSQIIRSRYCARIDAWTAQRIATVLAETAKTGKIPQPPPPPWIFKAMKIVTPKTAPSRQKDNDHQIQKAPRPQTERAQKPNDEF